MEFLKKLEEYYEEFDSKMITIPSLKRLPAIDFVFKQEVIIPEKLNEPFFKEPYIKFKYGVADDYQKKVLSIAKKVKDPKAKKFLTDAVNKTLDTNWLYAIITEQKNGIPWLIKHNIHFTDILFIPTGFLKYLDDMKRQVESIALTYYGRLIRTDYIPVDLYSVTPKGKVLDNMKVQAFLEYPHVRKSFNASLVTTLTWIETNQPYKNILIQLLSLKHCLVIGGNMQVDSGSLRPKINDFAVLFSRFFTQVKLLCKIYFFGKHGIRFYCEGFKGISDDTYKKLLDELLKNEEFDIETMFKEKHVIIDTETIRESLDAKVQYLVDYYREHPEIKDERKLFEQAQATRTAEAIAKSFM
jgi:hypothetical protein